MEQKYSVQVNMTVLDDGNAKVDIMHSGGITLLQAKEILCKGISMIIKSEKGPVKQASSIREVIWFLQQDFVDPKSFDNVWIPEK